MFLGRNFIRFGVHPIILTFSYCYVLLKLFVCLYVLNFCNYGGSTTPELHDCMGPDPANCTQSGIHTL